MDHRYQRRQSRSPERRDRLPDRRLPSTSRSRGRDRQEFEGHYERRSESTATLPISSDGLLAESLADLPSKTPIPPGATSLKLQYLTPENPDGKKTLVYANHFVVQSLPGSPVFQYSLRFRIPQSSQRRGTDLASKQQCARAMAGAKMAALFDSNFVWDNVSKGYSTTNTSTGPDGRTTTIDMPGHSLAKPNQVEISMRNDGPLQFTALIRRLQSDTGAIQDDKDTAERCLNALKTIFRDYPENKAGMVSVPNSSAFYKRVRGLVSPIPSTAGVLEALNGVFQSLTISFGGQLCLNVDTVCSAFYTPDLRLLDAGKTFAGIRPDEQVRGPNMNRFRSGCDRLAGLFFVVKHQRGAYTADTARVSQQGGSSDIQRPRFVSKTMRVKGLTNEDAANTRFDCTDPTTNQTISISVAQYFQRRYQIRLEHPHLPLIKTQRDGYFPLELCYTAVGERYKEPLQGPETADFIKACTVPAFVRKNKIHDHLKRLQWHRQPLLRDMGLSVSTSLLEIRAKLLLAPIPAYASGTDKQAPTDGLWNLRGKIFKDPQRYKAWGLLYLRTTQSHVSEEAMKDFCRELAKACDFCGMGTPNGPPVTLEADPNNIANDQSNETMDQLIKKLVRNTNQKFGCRKPDILLFVLHRGSDPKIYRAIKNICEIDGIVSQVLVAEKSVLSRKGAAQYCANLALKMNVKLGGINWTVPDRLYGPNVMMLGADVSHPGPSELRRPDPPPSYCALVGSMDSNCVRYSGVSAGQGATQEFISMLGAMFDELLNRFEKRNGKLPEHIIYWRDGLSTSQIEEFKRSELQALLEVRNKRMPGKCKMTAINCIKRHHTRLFPGNKDHGDKNGNVLPGTVCENDRNNNDFFIVTQKALQGCAVPLHYVSLYDENKLSAQQIQSLVMAGTFGYQRATRSVSLHPAVYYAHQVAERAKMHLRDQNKQTVVKDVHQDLWNTMYWQ